MLCRKNDVLGDAPREGGAKACHRDVRAWVRACRGERIG